MTRTLLLTALLALGIASTEAVAQPSLRRSDFDGDGKADLAVFRPSDGIWYIRYRGTGTTAGFQWGNQSDVPVPGDYNGDGKTDVAVFRPADGTWYVWYTDGTTAGFQWGNARDVPTPGDYDGDGKTDVAVFRPSNGTWYIQYSGTGTPAGFQWGNESDVPVPGDYNGDGKTDVAVFRPSNGTWYVWYTGGTTAGFQWGSPNDMPVIGDFDGDGKTDFAVFRSHQTWYVWYTRTGTPAGFQWGSGRDVPVPGDYDGDGATEIAVFRPRDGTWRIMPSATCVDCGDVPWGNSGDLPLPRPSPDYAGTWVGATEQGRPITFQVSDSGVTSLTIGYVVQYGDCLESGSVTLSLTSSPWPITGGAFEFRRIPIPPFPKPLSVMLGSLGNTSASGVAVFSALSCSGSAVTTWTATKGYAPSQD